MALAQTRAGDADELRLLVKLREIPGPDITHCRAQATGELMHHFGDRALVGPLPFDAPGPELQRVLDVLLEITVGRATRQGPDRTHAAIGLVGTALPQEHLARRLVGAGEQRADH